ncbi:MAG: lysophospholipid acyltransferase family protein [Lutibacter sp.]|nr:lysophospholipid acyltransferase family protein [Lutibacter sp.]MBP9600915.1 lysophospholipid acyltransferase family protein [Lutibacter sp.]
MNYIVYMLVYPIIWLISMLPFRVLYFISDGVYYLLYYVFGYRKKTVAGNLKLVFPEKTDKELKTIEKRFYHHLVDVFIEMLKSFTVSKEAVYKRYTFTNVEIFDELFKDGKSIALVGPHYANWEWIMSLDSFVKYNGVAAYTKINNPYFNNKMLKSRSKFGTNMIQTSRIIAEMQKNKKENVPTIYGLLSDQSPHISKAFYWSKFLGVKVPIHTGAEMLAKRFDMNVVYIATKKIKRGHYETTFSLITDNATSIPDYQITDIFLEKVEAQIRKEPAYYFWTHRRFKHKDKAPD